MKDLVVLILAGGEGIRFSPLVTDKALFPFFEKPLLAESVDRIFSVLPEIKRIVIVANPTNASFFRGASYPVPHEVVVQPEAKGMADAILRAGELIRKSRILVLIADDIFDPAMLRAVVDAGEVEGVAGVLPGWKAAVHFPGGYMILEEKRITSIIEKPDPGKEPSSFVNISGHYYADSDLLLSTLAQTDSLQDDYYERALSGLMQTHTFHMVPYTGQFCSLKYPWHVLSVMEQLLPAIESFRGMGVIINNYVTIEGNVHLGNNVKVMEGSKIVGPCYIGDNTIVGNNNVIRASMIAPNCVTGFNTDITRSYIGGNCWFHSNYIGDSVLESDVSMGSGSVLANLRLDEKEIYSVVGGKRMATQRNKLGAMIAKNVRIGVNVSIMPGVKIGAKSSIGAGITVLNDVEPESFVSGTTVLTKQKNTWDIAGDRSSFKSKL